MMNKTRVTLIALLVLPAALAAANSDRAKIVTHLDDRAHCIGPVVITHIDGDLRQLPSLGFNLEPGSHSLQGAAGDSGGVCVSARTSRRNPPGIGQLEAEFEAGKVYYVGVDHSSRDPEDWRLRIWKTEDGNGNVLMDIRRGEAAPGN